MTNDNDSPPAFDAAVFRTFIQDVGSIAVAQDFVASFCALLPARIRRIDCAVSSGDLEEIRVTLLSLRASSAMLGATQLEMETTRALAHISEGIFLTHSLKRTLDRQALQFERAFTQTHSTT